MLLAFVALAVATLALLALPLWDVRHPEVATPIMVLTHDTDGRIISVPATTYHQERACEEPTTHPSPAGAPASVAA